MSATPPPRSIRSFTPPSTPDRLRNKELATNEAPESTSSKQDPVCRRLFEENVYRGSSS